MRDWVSVVRARAWASVVRARAWEGEGVPMSTPATFPGISSDGGDGSVIHVDVHWVWVVQDTWSRRLGQKQGSCAISRSIIHANKGCLQKRTADYVLVIRWEAGEVRCTFLDQRSFQSEIQKHEWNFDGDILVVR